MKWIFALNAESVDSYGDFARVAVLSARQNSSLQAVCLFDGDECELTDWMRAQNVEVVRARSRFRPELERIAREQNEPLVLRIGAGTFLRMEISQLARERNWPDEFVLYTDCDVIFKSDPCPLLEPLRPRLFAVAPETFRDKPLHMNAGVMWMNVRALDNPAFEEWTRRFFLKCLASSFDQGAYRSFYNPLHARAWKLNVPDSLFYAVMSRLPHRTWKWDALPLELNWKPYWGPNPQACVIHFHGLKPTQRSELAANTLPPFIARMHTPFWDECAAKWDELLEEASTIH